MSNPKAYEPEYGYKYQILAMYKDNKSYDHLDYAETKKDLNYLMNEYRPNMQEFKFKVITLPRKYWKPKKEVVTVE